MKIKIYLTCVYYNDRQNELFQYGPVKAKKSNIKIRGNRMNRNVWIGGIAVVAVMAIGTILIVTKGSSNSPKAVQVQVAGQDKRTDSPEVKSPPSSLTASAEVKEQKIPATKKTDSPSAQSSSPQDNKKDAPDMMSMMKERMKDPAMREQMLKMTKIQMSRLYAPLFNDLSLDDAKREAFNDIMTDYTAKSMDMAFGDSDGTPKQEDAAKLQSDLEADLKDLLGADFPKYEEFKDSMQSRQTVELFNQNLASEEKLDPELQKSLVKALSEENKLWQNTLSANGELNKLNKGDLSSEAFDALEKNMAELNKRYVERAASYLNEKQLKAFKDTLDQQLSMIQLGRSFIQKKQ